MAIRNTAGLTIIVMSLCAAAHAGDWRGFRGPTGMGVVDSELPLRWGGDDNLNVKWRAALPVTLAKGQADHNQSSPIVVGGRVIVSTAHWASDVEDRKSRPAEHHVSCYAAADGELLWDTVVEAGPWVLKDLRGGYAATTPVSDGERVYVLFGSSVLYALDVATGRMAWSRVIEGHEHFDVAIAAGPVLFEDTVLVVEDKKKESRLVAYDTKTGAARWSRDRPGMGFSHATPLLTEVNGDPQLIVSASHALQGVDPRDGKVIWSCDWGRSIWPVSRPVHADGLVYCVGGRSGHPGVVVDPTAHGDVTETHLKWRVPKASQGMSSPVVVDGRVYRVHKPGVIVCVDLKTGKEVFKERFGDADTAVSPIATPDGRIYFASAGTSVVIEAGDTLNVLATNELGDPSKASPAVSDGALYLKGAKYLYRISE